jgi:hypothetical protein
MNKLSFKATRQQIASRSTLGSIYRTGMINIKDRYNIINDVGL